MPDVTGQLQIRGVNVEKAVKGFALPRYIFKDVCTISSSSAYEEAYFTEPSADLTNTGSAVKGIPRGAQFPYGEVSFTKKKSYHKKHGMEVFITIEDEKMNDVPTIARHLLRIARSVTRSVDAEIWDVVTEGQSPVDINSVTIAAGSEWDSANIALRDPIDNILAAIQAIEEQEYDTDAPKSLFLNPKDFRNLMSNPNVRNAGQFYTSDVTRNGKVGFLLGCSVKKSNRVTADYALVMLDKEACNWKEVMPLTTITELKAGIGTTIRSWEMGSAQLVNPKACCLISNTAA